MIQAKPLFAVFLCIGVLSVVHIALRTDTTRLPIALLSTVEPLTVDSQTTDDPETMCGRMVVLTASVTEVTHSTPYPLLLPLTARAWLAAGFRPVIVLAVFQPDEWQNSALGLLLMADLRLIEGSFIFILPSPTPFIEVALAQTVRLFITAVLPCSDGYLRVSDADMIVYQGEPFQTEDVEGVHVYNGDCCRPQLPMHSIGMSVRLWKDLFMPVLNLTSPVTLSRLSRALTQLLVNEGLNLNAPMQFGKEHGWFIDQIYAGRVIHNYASSQMLRRIHTGDVYSDGVIESHEHKIVVSQLPQLQERIEMSNLRTAAAFRDWSWIEWYQRAIPVLLDPTKYIVTKLPFSPTPLVVVDGVAARGWWEHVGRGEWELETFKVFNQEIDSSTAYVGFGEWTGVTALYAARLASKAVFLDVDPIAFSELKTNIALNWDILRMQGRVVVQSKCIWEHAGVLSVNRADGSSGSSVLPHGSESGTGVHIECQTLPDFCEAQGITTDRRLFLKIDTEGGESVILPSLLQWVDAAIVKPTIFVSMHATADATQKKKIASLFNKYKFFAVVPGRELEAESQTIALALSSCSEGVSLHHNVLGKHFDEHNICNWCDYLLVEDNTRSNLQCRPTESTETTNAAIQLVPYQQVHHSLLKNVEIPAHRPEKLPISKSGFTCPIQAHDPSILDISSQVWIHVDRELSTVEGRDIYYPYYTSDFIFDNLVQWQLADTSVFEFGGGRSSIWWASRVRSLTVIDDKSEYLCFIDSELRSLKSTRADVTLFKYDAGCKACVLDSFAKLNQSFDIIVIDGEPTEYRCDMLMAALSYLKKPNGIIVADNWDQPEVWHNPPCVSVIENAYSVQKFKHSARFGKEAHTNGWSTMFFRPTGVTPLVPYQQVYHSLLKNVEGEFEEAYVCFLRGIHYARLATAAIMAVMEFSSRPLLLFVDNEIAVRAHELWPSTAYARLVVYELRSAGDILNPWFDKIKVAITSPVKNGVIIEADTLITTHADKLFQILREHELSDASMFPLMPEHPDVRWPDCSLYSGPSKACINQYAFPLARRSMDYMHAHLLWTKSAKPFLESVLRRCRTDVVDIDCSSDESALNTALWIAGATKQIPLMDPHYSALGLWEHHAPASDIQLLFGHNASVAFMFIHGCKDPVEALAILPRIRAMREDTAWVWSSGAWGDKLQLSS